MVGPCRSSDCTFFGALFAELVDSAHINSREKRRTARCWRERGVPPLKAQRYPFITRTTHYSFFNERDSTVERSVFGTSFLAWRDNGPDSGLGRRSCLEGVVPGAGLPGASASWRATGFCAPRFTGAPDEPGTRGETPSGTKMNSMEMPSEWHHFAPRRIDLRKRHKQHSALGLRRASRAGRELGPAQHRIRPPRGSTGLTCGGIGSEVRGCSLSSGNRTRRNSDYPLETTRQGLKLRSPGAL